MRYVLKENDVKHFILSCDFNKRNTVRAGFESSWLFVIITYVKHIHKYTVLFALS